jgi:hypothetical protein
MATLFACSPEYPYARVLGPGRFDLRCHRGSPDCARMARELCRSGYQIAGTRTGTIGTSQIIECAAETYLGQTVAAPERAPHEEAEEAPEGEEEDVPMCAEDRECAGIRQRCFQGTCVTVPVGLTAEEAEQCVIGTATSEDPVALFPTEGTLAEFLSNPPQSKATTLSLVARLSGTWVDFGVACRTIAQFVRGRRVQITSGPLTGLQGWVAWQPGSAVPPAPPGSAAAAPGVRPGSPPKRAPKPLSSAGSAAPAAPRPATSVAPPARLPTK